MIDNKVLNYIKHKKSKEIFNERKIETATIEILTACNFKCIHCYNQDLETRFLNIDMFKKIMNQLVENGCKSITLTGGEPLLHPNFAEMYKFCADKGLKISLFTNGYFIDKYIELLKAYKPKKVEISLYGTNNNTYEKICKIKEGFDKVIANIKLLVENNINLKLKTIVMQQNFCEFDEMKSICNNFHVPFKFDLIILNSKNFTNNQQSNILDDSYTEFMTKVKEEKLDVWKQYPVKNKENKNLNLLYKCYAGRKSIFISSNAYARICNFAEFSEQDLNEKSVLEAWKSFDKYLNLEVDKNSKCFNCKYKYCCGNCPVSTYMDKKTDGKVILPVEQNCREAKFIYEAITNDDKKSIS